MVLLLRFFAVLVVLHLQINLLYLFGNKVKNSFYFITKWLCLWEASAFRSGKTRRQIYNCQPLLSFILVPPFLNTKQKVTNVSSLRIWAFTDFISLHSVFNILQVTGSTVNTSISYRKNNIWFYCHHIFQTYKGHRETLEYITVKWTVVKIFMILINVTEFPSLHTPLTATSYYCTESDLILSRFYIM